MVTCTRRREERMDSRPIDEDGVRTLLANVRDPEIPVLTIEDLGILRDVRVSGSEVTVVITPTYSGCPAMRAIEQDIERVLMEAGCRTVTVETKIAPAWTTDWMSEAGRGKLRAIGIAPPVGATGDKEMLRGGAVHVICPQCGAFDTERLSEFGSTACKALYRCCACLEPFDYFKCL